MIHAVGMHGLANPIVIVCLVSSCRQTENFDSTNIEEWPHPHIHGACAGFCAGTSSFHSPFRFRVYAD